MKITVTTADDMRKIIKEEIQPIIHEFMNFTAVFFPSQIKGDEMAGKILKKNAQAVQKMRERGHLQEGIHYHKEGRAIIYHTHSLLYNFGGEKK